MRGFWVDLGYACFGIGADARGVVCEAAPIAGWMVGKTLQEIKPFLLRKGAKVVEIKVSCFFLKNSFPFALRYRIR